MKLSKLEMDKLQDIADGVEKIRSVMVRGSDSLSDFMYDEIDLSLIDEEDMPAMIKVKKSLILIGETIEKLSKDAETLIDHFSLN